MVTTCIGAEIQYLRFVSLVDMERSETREEKLCSDCVWILLTLWAAKINQALQSAEVWGPNESPEGEGSRRWKWWKRPISKSIWQ